MSEGYNAIIICINQLIKIRHFMLVTTEVITEDTANLFLNYVYKLHGFPDTVMSD